MSDPPRLRTLADGEGDFARALLRSADPTRALTAADAARLSPLVAKAAASSAWLTVGAATKLLAALALVSAGALAARAHRAPHAPPHTSARSAPQRAAAPVALAIAPTLAAPVEAVAPAPSLPAAVAAPRAHAPPQHARRVVPGPAAAPSAAEPTLTDELRVIERARAALRSDPASAVAALTDAERAMPRGQLRDERDALLVEALVRSGAVADARARAAMLEQRAPQSPQSARVRALLRDAP
jgi:hypothetical protein